MSNEQFTQQQIQNTVATQAVVSSSDGQYGSSTSWPITPSSLSHGGQIDQILPALFAAKTQFPIIQKTEYNDFTKSKFADLAGIERSIKPILTQNGLILLQPCNPHEHVSGSVWIDIETILFHQSGQFLCTKAVIPYMAQRAAKKKDQNGKSLCEFEETKVDAHGLAAAITYFRRYMLISFLGLTTDDDDGNTAMQQQYPQRQWNQPAQPTQHVPNPENIRPEHVPTHDFYQAAQPQQVEKSQTPSLDEIKLLENDVAKLGQEYQDSLTTWLKEHGYDSIDQLKNNVLDFNKIQFRVDRQRKLQRR